MRENIEPKAIMPPRMTLNFSKESRKGNNYKHGGLSFYLPGFGSPSSVNSPLLYHLGIYRSSAV